MDISIITKISRLVQRKKKDGDGLEWVLISKSKPYRILKRFGPRKPSKKRVHEEEKRIQYFKHASKEITNKMQDIISNLNKRGIVHIADVLSNCAELVTNGKSQNNNIIRLNRVVSILQSKGEVELAENLDVLIPDILAFGSDIDGGIEIEEDYNQIVRISAKRAFNIVKLLRKKYLDGEIDTSDFEYSKMNELEVLLKTGFILSMPKSYDFLPNDSNNWWDHFCKKAENFMPFPSSYKSSLKKGKKDITHRILDEQGKYKEDKVYDVGSYSGKPWDVKIKIVDIETVKYKDLDKEYKIMEDLKPSDKVDIITFKKVKE
jgi:hypothetical protein